MPFSAMIALSKHFISKPLNKRINVVKKIYTGRVLSHLSFFTVVNIFPHMHKNQLVSP